MPLKHTRLSHEGLSLVLVARLALGLGLLGLDLGLGIPSLANLLRKLDGQLALGVTLAPELHELALVHGDGFCLGDLGLCRLRHEELVLLDRGLGLDDLLGVDVEGSDLAENLGVPVLVLVVLDWRQRDGLDLVQLWCASG